MTDELLTAARLPLGLDISPSPYVALRGLVVAFDALDAQQASPLPISYTEARERLQPYVDELEGSILEAVLAIESAMVVANMVRRFGAFRLEVASVDPGEAVELVQRLEPLRPALQKLSNALVRFRDPDEDPREVVETLCDSQPDLPGLRAQEVTS